MVIAFPFWLLEPIISVLWNPMRPTIEAAFDRGVVITSHRFCRHECRDRPAVDLAVVIERTIQGYQHVFVAPVVAHGPEEAASCYVCTIKKPQIDFAAVFDVHALGSHR